MERSGGELSDGDRSAWRSWTARTVEASTGGAACIAGDIDTGHRVQVTATLPEQEIDAIIVRVPVTVESDATAKYEE